MKTKNPPTFCLLGIVLMLLPGLVRSQSDPASDDTTLVVFSRHTFRGTAKKTEPTKIFLSQYGIDLVIPMDLSACDQPATECEARQMKVIF
jgi:hypothetical protein